MDTIDSITIIAAAWGLLVLRLTLAFILWPHGTQKVLGWFGGAGWEGTYRAFTEKMGIPLPGQGGHADGIFRPYLPGTGRIHQNSGSQRYHPHGRSHNQTRQKRLLLQLVRQKAGEGVEFHLLYAGSAFALFLTGPGPWSVDAWCMNIVHVIFG